MLLENSFRCTHPPTPIQRIHKLISFAADIIYPSRGKVLHNPLQEVLAADFRNAALLWSWTERERHWVRLPDAGEEGVGSLWWGQKAADNSQENWDSRGIPEVKGGCSLRRMR